MEKISCILVTYNPQFELFEKVLQSLISQVDNIIIVDNSCDDRLNSFLTQKNYNNIYTLYLGANFGIAYAQNAGIKYLLQMQQLGGYVLFLDQDSILSENMIFHLYNELKYVEQINPLSIIGPVSFNRKENCFYDFKFKKKIREDLFEVNEIISSGTLTPLKLLETYKFESDLFIDYVDFEWCWRLRSDNVSIFITTKVYLEHQLGDGSIDLKFLKLTHCTPMRTYYITRNTLILSGRNYVPLSWKFKSIIRCIIRIILFPLFIKPRKEYFNNMRKGFIDGIKNI